MTKCIKLLVMYVAMTMIYLGFVGCEGGGGDDGDPVIDETDSFNDVVGDIANGIGYDGAK